MFKWIFFILKIKQKRKKEECVIHVKFRTFVRSQFSRFSQNLLFSKLSDGYKYNTDLFAVIVVNFYDSLSNPSSSVKGNMKNNKVYNELYYHE